MHSYSRGWFISIYNLFFFLALFVVASPPALAGEYDNALKDVKNYDAVYEFSQGDPKVANLVFWAIKNSYEVDEVKKLPGGSHIVVVFHGPVVKLISSDKAPFNAAEWAEVEKFQETIRQMKKDGVKFEVCLYAAKVFGVNEATIMPEIDHVGNGFVSVIGYQMQGYAVVRVP
jgi:intracellular sulfur oxidation DsrE/DsrF family protein